MPLITLILFFIFVGLLMLLTSTVRKRAKIKKVAEYGHAQFEIDLPNTMKVRVPATLPALTSMSDAEGFFTLITPYIGSLTKHKRDYLFQHVTDLKNELKMNKDVYQNFMTEYAIYKDLSEKAAAKKWAGE